ncbi:Cof subfamily protein (haloacid dehalogenase superfamily)/HAD superfamily hydrolase (TIGR01484 family) [Paenibacillus cellulosilyticus]|uniref:Cof subfamily protein (Haloacid dehalogenase superfamily)/HAD superfamily hydrolase (TIGR01484 family) n=1 Tax=Paenibacillus cellulosilyticus TaxID=375489 RepID=A0A2V2YLD8_9BACL|nr:HAD family hydrolase [Paenibacillus cellulosilyticus]PWV94450.1 Cof subfamily protein (haloacid dehalogenase superfamily)/HAD superfamily hydrolase (TIGR01484 family) [Paenibacillus cellulosilyticus]QKS44970.1 HAD family hydrolase [Paenibacillus cellulosilyticus]
MKVSIVVLDLDGTFLNSEKQISERNYNAVMKCHQQGMKIIFATARPPRSVKYFLPEDLRGIGSFIYYNGAYIECPLTGINHHELIHSKLTAELLDYCITNNPELDINLEVKDEWMSLKEYDYSSVTKVREFPVIKSLDELKKQEATKVLCSGKIDVDSLKERFSNKLNIVVTDNGELVQISSDKASKETAVTLLCERLGVPLEEVMVFGDDYNDVGLFKICGWPVAMGNAVGDLKEIAKEITDTNDDDGVAKVLERSKGY